MSAADIAQLVLSGFLLLILLGFLVWGILTRQFRNIEAAKYRIFEVDEGEDEQP